MPQNANQLCDSIYIYIYIYVGLFVKEHRERKRKVIKEEAKKQ